MIQPFWRAIWNYALPFNPAILLLGLYPKEVIDKTTYTIILIAALIVVAKNWKMKECPSIGE